jgi:hypothetical protein
MFIPGIEESCGGDAWSLACACGGGEGSEFWPVAWPHKIVLAPTNTTKNKFLLN